MNKKFKLLISSPLIALPAIAAVSCGTTNKVHNWNLVVKNYLTDVSHEFADTLNEKGVTYNLVNGIDSIHSPEMIAISESGFDLLSKMKFITDDRETYVKTSASLKFTSSNADWTIDKDGVVTSIKPGTQTDVTVSVGGASKTIHLINRQPIINHKVSNFSNLKVTGLHVTTTTVGQVTKDLSVEGKNYESINMIYSDTNNDPTKRVNIYANTFEGNDAANLIKVNGTVDEVALLVYLDKEYEGKDFWARTAWNLDKFQTTGNIGDINPYNYPCVDFSEQHYVAHSGWNLLQIHRDVTKMNLAENYLSVLRFIQMKNSNPSGTIHLAGVFESDEEMKLEDLLPLVEKH